MFRALVYFGLILFGVLIGMGATGEQFYDAIFGVKLPYDLLGDLKGIVIVVATGVYASLVVARYQELKDAKRQVAKEWTIRMHPFVLGGYISSSDEEVIRIRAELSSARMRMGIFYQRKAHQDYADVINMLSKLVDEKTGA